MIQENHANFHVIKDPVHGTMQFSNIENNWIKPFIDSANFQRLRHIKQIGMGDLVFPGAVHTRFNHALGACYVAGQIASKLGLSIEQKKIAMIAALLHDIGHGPFSHAFEGIFHDSILRHEDWTPLFLSEYASDEFLSIFRDKNMHCSISHEESTLIQNLIMHKETEQKLLADIVSSQLDADRLDYLRRDSHFCGVTYGEYDFRWLLHCLAIVPDHQGFERLGITSKGIGVAEEYLMARRLMVRNVYFHGKKHAAEFLLTMFLQALADTIKEISIPGVNVRTLTRFLLNVADLNQAVKADPHNRKTLKEHFLREQYPLYKKLCDYDVLSMIRHFAELDTDQDVVLIAKRLHNRQLPKTIHLDKSHVEKAKHIIEEIKHKEQLAEWQLSLLELPHQSYQGSRDPILVVDKMNRVRNLRDDSVLISGLSDRYEKEFLLFIDRQLLNHSSVKPLLELMASS